MRPELIDRDGLLVHNWRAAQLKRLELPHTMAEAYADRLDWHQVARLVQHGCPPAARPAHRRLTQRRDKEDPVANDAYWRDNAACLHADPDLFSPHWIRSTRQNGSAEPVRCRKRCLAKALDLRAISGIWGGTTDDERRAIRVAVRGRRRVHKAAQA
jgi:WhiB family transcriptional regulator, redox-sensing transcriptional regulator